MVQRAEVYNKNSDHSHTEYLQLAMIFNITEFTFSATLKCVGLDGAGKKTLGCSQRGDCTVQHILSFRYIGAVILWAALSCHRQGRAIASQTRNRAVLLKNISSSSKHYHGISPKDAFPIWISQECNTFPKHLPFFHSAQVHD